MLWVFNIKRIRLRVVSGDTDNRHISTWTVACNLYGLSSGDNLVVYVTRTQHLGVPFPCRHDSTWILKRCKRDYVRWAIGAMEMKWRRGDVAIGGWKHVAWHLCVCEWERERGRGLSHCGQSYIFAYIVLSFHWHAALSVLLITVFFIILLPFSLVDFFLNISL